MKNIDQFDEEKYPVENRRDLSLDELYSLVEEHDEYMNDAQRLVERGMGSPYHPTRIFFR